MRRLLSLVLGLSVILGSVGCVQMSKEAIVANHSTVKALTEGETITESYSEHVHRLTRVASQDAKALVEDVDMVMQRDRPTRLSRWHDR